MVTSWFSMPPSKPLILGYVPKTGLPQIGTFKSGIFQTAAPIPAGGVPKTGLPQIGTFHFLTMKFNLLIQIVENGFPTNWHIRFLYPLNGAGYRARKTK
jgi:hypothetical protein